MSGYRQILYHIVFRTKHNLKTLSLINNPELFAYISGFLKNRSCHLYRINRLEDHVHILSDLHPSVALADLIRDIKTSTSIWIKRHGGFSRFDGWAEGYAALTYSYGERDTIIEYIKNQQNHHRKISCQDELRSLLIEAGINIDERYFP